MVTALVLPKSIPIMCAPATSGNPHNRSGRKHKLSSGRHRCVFKLLECSSKQLCIFCFLLYYFAIGSCAAAFNSTFSPVGVGVEPAVNKVQCDSGGNCKLNLSSSEQALKNMYKTGGHLFKQYLNNSTKYMNEEGLEKFMTDIGLIIHESHEGHDHENHEEHTHEEDHEIHERDDHDAHEQDHENHERHIHDDHEEDHEIHERHDHDAHEGHDYDSEDLGQYKDFLHELFDNDDASSEVVENSEHPLNRRSSKEIPCISSVKELVQAYFLLQPSQEISLTLEDFITLMPQILLDIKRPECRITEDHEGNEKSKDVVEHSEVNVWLISFGVVTIISLVSLLGVLLIPLLRHSNLLNQTIAFLVALAVGTLAGDALLHLLPHANGAHDHTESHEGHGHGDSEEEEEDHFASMWKGLMACAGIYVFFLLETAMGLFHRRKFQKKQAHKHICEADTPSTNSPSKLPTSDNKDDFTVQYYPSQSPIHRNNGHVPNGNAGISSSSADSKAMNDSASQVPLIHVNGTVPNGQVNENGDPKTVIEIDEEPLETGHHHHHHHSHEVPKTIANFAWMIIVGDGLHNVTDGLAIGAAFTSSIGAGLGTSLAIFFHEIPQELGDFAILLNSGMTVKQALLCNFLSALLCFVGLLIGLLVGEYTTGIILWILAFTAGGFLYIALVDMLPAMIKQLEHKDYLKRFLIQNAGILTGFGLMIIIALREESFSAYF